MDTNNNETKNTIGENLLSLRTLVKKWISFFLVSIIVILVILLLGFYYLFFRTPDGFVPDTVVNISQGQSLISAAKELRQDHIVTWPTALIVAGVMYKGEHTVVAGDYLFDKPLNVFNVAYRITHGVFNMTPIKVTLPEGTTVSGYSKIILSKIPGFDTDAFWSQASTSEGYLFPDTYFLSPKITATDTINFLTSNFQQKMKSVEPEIAKSGHTENEILTMASILEQEVQTSADRAIVAGILWKRLANGMPLQVDSTIGYIVGKKSADLTKFDLAIDSPFNTYKNKGLPPSPICNPGLDSINAALHSTDNPYLYFLSDKQGITHYASTFAEHVKNKKKYLN